MKLRTLFLFIVSCLASFSYAQDNPQPTKIDPPKNVLRKIKQSGVLRLGVENEAPPMNYLEGEERHGFDYEMAQAFAKSIGVSKIEVIEAEYGDLPQMLVEGKVDLVMSGYVADPSIEGVEWSDPYLDFGLCMLVRKGSAIKELKHLKNKTLGIYDDPSTETWVEEQNFGIKELKKFDGETGWLAALEKGEVDAVIYDYPFAIEEIKEFPKLKIAQLNLNSSSYSAAIPAFNSDLLDAFNSFLQTYLESKDYEKVVKKYLQTDALAVGDIPKGAKVYKIKKGDTLGKISGKMLGSSKKWKELWELNKNRLPNAHLVSEGMTIIIP